MGAINSFNGLFQYGGLKKYFNKWDVREFIGHLRKKFGKKKKLAILLDNASVHRAYVVRMLFEEEDITPIFICPYSP